MFSTVRGRVVARMAGGVAVAGLPVAAWWWRARVERERVAEGLRDRRRLPAAYNAADVLDQIVQDQCQAGDVVLFDRRPQTCAAGPWAALACLASRALLCGDDDAVRTVSQGRFDHVGVVVPGYVRHKADAFDPANLLLLEATASQGIAARPLKSRLEHSQARTVVLIPLQVPGERRDAIGQEEEDYDDDDKKKKNKNKNSSPQSAQALSAARTRQHLEKELANFRDKWIQLGQDKQYRWMHSTLTLGGALVFALGLADYVEGPVSPAAWLVLMALQQGAAATNLDIKQRNRVLAEDFVRHPSLHDERAVRLRPGWRFLAPINVRSR